MLELIQKYNQEVDRIGKDDFIKVRDQKIKEWTGKSLRTFRSDITKYNRANDVDYGVMGDGKYHLKEVELLEGQTSRVKSESCTNHSKTIDEPLAATETDRVVQTSLYIKNILLKKLKINAIIEEQSQNDIIIKLIEEYLRWECRKYFFYTINKYW